MTQRNSVWGRGGVVVADWTKIVKESQLLSLKTPRRTSGVKGSKQRSDTVLSLGKGYGYKEQ